MSGKPIVIEGEDAMRHLFHCQMIARLRIEIKTGMVHSGGSTIKLAARVLPITARTKNGALAQLEDLYLQTYGKEYGK